MRPSVNHPSRGSALIAVVALLVIIALMGTTYLITVRTDRGVVFGQGAVANDTAFPTANSANMDLAETTAATFAEQTLRNALRPDPAQLFRNPAAPDSAKVDHPQTSTFLASKAPAPRRIMVGAANNDPDPGGSYWPFISGPFRFDTTNIIPLESPLDMTGTINLPAPVPGAYPAPLNAGAGVAANRIYDNTGKTERGDLRVGSLKLTYPSPFYPTPLAGKTRVFPAFVNADNTARYLAADADGNGTADSALFRLDISPDTLTYAGDPNSHSVTYWAAVRIVDNSAQLNLNTAYRAADRLFDNTDVLPNTLQHGLRGAFRSNANLQTLLDPASQNADLAQLDRTRFASLTALPPAAQTPIDDLSPTGTRSRTDYEFLTQGDAFEHQFARRLNNPGLFDASGHRYRGFPAADMQALAFREGLVNPNLARTQVEQSLYFAALFNSPNFGYSVQGLNKSFGFYPANAEVTWYGTGYTDDSAANAADRRSALLAGGAPNYANSTDVPARSLRSFATTTNPLMPTIAAHDMAGIEAANRDDTGANANLMPTHRSGATFTAAGARRARLVNVNRASFGELWRAYWDVMSDDAAGGSPFADTGTRQFRPGDRYATHIIDAPHQMLLRAAGAAVNTLRFRDASNPSVGIIKVVPDVGSGRTACVYGIQPQLFLTEIYANTDNETVLPSGQNTQGYLAIELHNPFPTPINAINYRLLLCSRAAGALTVTSEIPFNTLQQGGSVIGSLSVPANGHIVIENYMANTGTARYRPAAATGSFGSTYYCANLQQAIGQEMIIVGPRNPVTAGLAATSADLMPIDAFSFDGLTVQPLLPPPPVPGDPELTKTAVAWHYVRVSGAAGSADQWKCVYPGRYNAGVAARRQEGTQSRSWTVTRLQNAENEPDDTNWTIDGWNLAGATKPTQNLGAADAAATYKRVYSVQLAKNTAAGNFPAPNPIINAGGVNKNHYPFGGFARNGDILNVPFLSASRIMTGVGTVNELTPITMAAAFADDAKAINDTEDSDANNQIEQLGRFCSLKAFDPTYPAASTDTYAFANRLFDYLTVLSQPKDDASPNLDAGAYKTNAPYAGNTAPEPVKNDLTGTANTNEDTIPLQGLININTAPWQVLAAIPWTREGDRSLTAAQVIDENRRIAKAIVRYRDVNDGTGSPHGPFKSILELNAVPAYAAAADIDDTAANTAFQALAGDVNTVNFTQAQGELTARNPTTTDDPAYGGTGHNPRYKQRFLVLNRVSNLLTTRSDSFTVYILVQAWQDAGTRFPVLVGERRSAYLMNRKAPTDNNLYNAAAGDQPIDSTGLLTN